MNFFDDLGFGDFFSSGNIAPESVARKVLGIGSAHELNEVGIKAVFRHRVKQLRPDLADIAVDSLSVKDVAGEEVEKASELRFASGSKQEQLAELLWARDDLLHRVPRPVTNGAGDSGVTRGERNAPEPVTSLADLTRAKDDHRNGRLVAEVERLLARHKGWAATSKHWREQTADEDKHITKLAKDFRLVCSHCTKLLEGTVYVYRTSWADGYWADRLRAQCEACFEKRSDRYWAKATEPRECGCGAEFCGLFQRYYSNSWWYGPRGQSCSLVCGRDRRNAEARERRRVARSSAECETCGEEFTSSRKGAAYCTSACRQKAYRGRKSGATA